MANDDKAAVAPTKPRTKLMVMDELTVARDRLKELHPKVEAMTAKINKQKTRIEQKQNQWRVDFPDEPFDPHHFNPPMIPVKPDEELQRDFHRLHYVIDDLETELDAFNNPRSTKSETK